MNIFSDQIFSGCGLALQFIALCGCTGDPSINGASLKYTSHEKVAQATGILATVLECPLLSGAWQSDLAVISSSCVAQSVHWQISTFRFRQRKNTSGSLAIHKLGNKIPKILRTLPESCRSVFTWSGFFLTLSLPSSKSTFSQPFKEKFISKIVRIGSMIIFHLSKQWKATFFILCDVIFLVKLQGKFESITLESKRVKARDLNSQVQKVCSPNLLKRNVWVRWWELVL